ncbi:3-deoxy-8-phosphooctulonate synthase [Chlorobium phaeovibrioides]|uniref:3-deoxy-8-phosphooctulonate synthase n=1 Tax=Chlorobium phaeovibrioides TaxID=1094 RepID=A0A3S0L2M9_CHLPH|nr:3-deoxy-8-phosphooctulonate synthase [Chlorobium phaeovibrioides]KAA6233233.1 3-deoxy-8-phosphooctulonate synthase [Chlorobium phaeovibrioides]MWV54222.1 3-deoxy-8-phosphooctulonate synthase [Chlorobium phaeovibrioides]RTY36638.1 3-deoxy-8-phosphooctulonate synthase [Chlorobium phaeovibrioides]RTY39441.1 3-deoxy-8-phosphooctulonate synthase [Chlorobium phaeovibrioides]
MFGVFSVSQYQHSSAVQKFSIGPIEFSSTKSPLLIAGPCLIESREMAIEVAEELRRITAATGVQFIFKGSYRKANRTSGSSFTGIGDEKALEVLADIGRTYGMPVLTDVHETKDVALASRYVDVLQIPAFLSRQTELLVAAGESGLAVNIKKGQFMAPQDMARAAGKVSATGNRRIMLTERGTSFGYNNLVVDFRGLVKMAESGWPVIYDATHSLQLPGAGDGVSGGERGYVLPLARAAVATGVNGLFFEVHPDPERAMSDAATQIPLGDFAPLVSQLLALYGCVQSLPSS